MESRVHSSLNQKCHHQTIYGKFNPKIHYSDRETGNYKREIWHYKYAITDLIQRSINYYPWEVSLSQKGVNEKFYVSSQTLFRTKQFCDDRDPP